MITAPHRSRYDKPVPSTDCFHVCAPLVPGHPVQVLELYGNGQYAVVLSLFSGGASCCGVDDVYVPSASIGSWVVTTHNFGQYGARIRRIDGHEVFLSGDSAFDCEFASCAASGLPIQVFAFSGDAFHNLTRRYPALIRADARMWLRAYQRFPGQGQGLLAAWAADEDNLGQGRAVGTELRRLVAEHHVSKAFVRELQGFLRRHGYTRPLR
jgi:hypothetical protein